MTMIMLHMLNLLPHIQIRRIAQLEIVQKNQRY
jgi:hypothetical protein